MKNYEIEEDKVEQGHREEHDDMKNRKEINDRQHKVCRKAGANQLVLLSQVDSLRTSCLLGLVYMHLKLFVHVWLGQQASIVSGLCTWSMCNGLCAANSAINDSMHS